MAPFFTLSGLSGTPKSPDVIRACLDGEGNWSQESHPDTVSQIRLKIETAWPDSFIERISQDIEHRCLPFLIDMGGRPRGTQLDLFRRCTHAILLLREDKPDDTLMWQHFIEENGVIPLAQLHSILSGQTQVTRQSPVLEGTVSGLERQRTDRAHGPAFDQLVERVATLFGSYTAQDLERVHFEKAPGDLINLSTFLAAGTRWQPEILSFFLTQLPTHTPLALYGVAPNWVYAAVAASTGQQPLYQFDPKLPFGWVQPLAVATSPDQHPDVQSMLVTEPEGTILSIQIPNTRLEYFQPEPFPLPPVPSERGLIINGRLPYWLLTAVIRHFRDQRLPWLATYYAPLSQAIVVYSRTDDHHPGDLLAMPTHK
ncbi:CRISPR-associated protein Csx3 [Dictyobacter arantiisoli]|uniref:Uncharacterized protein n=1 Tax=Dictyobacter arantiisoli TaxID=2014874 RepID=A0A5A5TLJ0_9CHLR|nr:CRISPR-associated protein Csx3 [Dictyobacter arantiisoli]GCF11983.1 hypothetical protein KDI_55470 [Dictyobacter arantiisoli]